MRDWDKHKRLNPDWIRNNPGVDKCTGRFVRIIDGKTRVYNCQLRHDHDGQCISYSGHKLWQKGNKVVKWDQLPMDLQTTNSSTEPLLSDHALNLLSQLGSDTKD